MPTITLKDASRQVSHPTKPGLLDVDDSTEAPELWVRQHLPLVRAGLIEVGEAESEESDRCEAETKSGSRCKRTAVDGERFCATHLDS